MLVVSTVYESGGSSTVALPSSTAGASIDRAGMLSGSSQLLAAFTSVPASCHACVMACDDEELPLQARVEAISDMADLEEVYNTERHLLYVACTRAREM